jgi:hypothetical protein
MEDVNGIEPLFLRLPYSHDEKGNIVPILKDDEYNGKWICGNCYMGMKDLEKHPCMKYCEYCGCKIARVDRKHAQLFNDILMRDEKSKQ